MVKDKPAEAHDLCTDGAGNELSSASCPILFPYYAEPRMVAGEPFTGDVLKCQLKPIDRNDYATALPPMTNDQFAQLRAIFHPACATTASRVTASSRRFRGWATPPARRQAALITL